LGNDCDIIVKRDRLTFLDRELPIETVTDVVRIFSTDYKTLTDAETVNLASEKMKKIIVDRTSEAMLLKISTEGAFQNEFYKLQTNIVCVEDITKDAPFEYSAN
jgi:hypothetical protein